MIGDETLPPFILWVDLETSGLDLFADVICEFGAVLTRVEDGDFVELLAREWPVRLSSFGRMRLKENAFVTEMHKESGLLDAMHDATKSIEEIDREFAYLLEQMAGKFRPWVGGSGVAKFDRNLMDRLMPETAALLDYRTIDIGQLRRWRKAAGVAMPSRPPQAAHRSMADVRQAIDEARWFMRRMKMEDAALVALESLA